MVDKPSGLFKKKLVIKNLNPLIAHLQTSLCEMIIRNMSPEGAIQMLIQNVLCINWSQKKYCVSRHQLYLKYLIYNIFFSPIMVKLIKITALHVRRLCSFTAIRI